MKILKKTIKIHLDFLEIKITFDGIIKKNHENIGIIIIY